MRSALESRIAAALDAQGAHYGYESITIPYVTPETQHRYTPDFILSNGVIIEAKGLFTASDRAKHLRIRADNPEHDIRFVFSNPNARIAKTSRTTYADWCRKHDFQFAHNNVPTSWTEE